MNIKPTKKKIAKYGIVVLGLICLGASFFLEGTGGAISFSGAIIFSLFAHFISEDAVLAPVIQQMPQTINCPYCKDNTVPFKTEDELDEHILANHKEELRKALGR